MSEIEMLGSGCYSIALKVGNYALKIGRERGEETYFADKRILQPLIRQSINRDLNEKNNLKLLYVEVQHIVDMDWNKGLTDEQIKEELYKVYKDLRSRGIICIDMKKENFGRLIHPNDGIYKLNYGETTKSNNGAIGAIGELKETLLPGELVLIDTDYIYKEPLNFVPRNIYMSYYKEFEERYLKEKTMDFGKE